MRHGRHHPALHQDNWLVRDVNNLSRTLHEAFQIATTGRPGPVVVDIPKDVQFQKASICRPAISAPQLPPHTPSRTGAIARAVEMMAEGKKPVFYTGGGIINAGRRRRRCANWWTSPVFPSPRP